MGDKGNTMKCGFHVSDSMMGLSCSHGYGTCEVSDGRVIDVTFSN